MKKSKWLVILVLIAAFAASAFAACGIPSGPSDKTPEPAVTDAAAEAKVFLDAVDALPAVESLTLAEKPAVAEALTIYNGLSVKARVVKGVTAAKAKADALSAQIVELEAAALFTAAAGALPALSEITLDDREGVDAALALYAGLSQKAKLFLDVAEAYARLTELSEKIVELNAPAVAEAFIRAVDALPSQIGVKIPDKAAVDAALALYAGLPDAAKELKSVADAHAAATALLAKIAELEDAQILAEASVFINAAIALPSVETVTTAFKPAVEAARTLWEGLSIAAKLVEDVLDAYNTVEALLAKIDEIEATQAFSEARATLLLEINALFAACNEADYFSEQWEELSGYYNGAIDTINGFTTFAQVQSYNASAKPALLAAISGVATKAQFVSAARSMKIAEGAALLAGRYLRADYSASNWATLSGYFTSAYAQVNALTTFNDIEAYSFAWVTPLADAIAKLPPFGTKDDADSQFGKARAETVHSGSGTIEMGRVNDASGRFFGTYDEVDYLLVNFYGRALDEETLTYGEEQLLFASRFTWQWTYPRLQKSVAPNYPGPYPWSIPGSTYDCYGTLQATTIAGDAVTIYSSQIFNNIYCTSVTVTAMLQRILGPAYVSGKVADISLSCRLVPFEYNDWGLGVESKRMRSTHAAWVGNIDPRVSAATTGFDNLVSYIGTVGNMAYNQAKENALIAAETHYSNLSPLQKTLVNPATLTLLGQLRTEFNRLEGLAVTALLNVIPGIETKTPTITALTPESQVIEFSITVKNAEAAFITLLPSTFDAYPVQLTRAQEALEAANAAVAATGVVEAVILEQAFLSMVSAIGTGTKDSRPALDYAYGLYDALPAASRLKTNIAAAKAQLDVKFAQYETALLASLPELVFSSPGLVFNTTGGCTFGACYNAMRNALAAAVPTLGLTADSTTAQLAPFVTFRIHFFLGSVTGVPNLSDSRYAGYIDMPALAGIWSDASIRAAMSAAGINDAYSYSCTFQWIDRAYWQGTQDVADRVARDSALTDYWVNWAVF
ncbi:MAG: hypothetical protein FWD58_06850 [Firmicutes bacterium]|nr:hypothetical protein [Bacillota bacterium]